MKTQPITPYIPRRKIGLGDAVAIVAEPIARVLNIPANCAPCGRRKDALNAAVPNLNPFSHGQES